MFRVNRDVTSLMFRRGENGRPTPTSQEKE
jgi:hypothetical protein